MQVKARFFKGRADKLVCNYHRRPNSDHVVDFHNVIIGMSDAAVTDTLPDTSWLIGAVQIDAPLIEADARYSQWIFVVLVVWLDCFLFWIDVFGRQPDRKFQFYCNPIRSGGCGSFV